MTWHAHVLPLASMRVPMVSIPVHTYHPTATCRITRPLRGRFPCSHRQEDFDDTPPCRSPIISALPTYAYPTRPAPYNSLCIPVPEVPPLQHLVPRSTIRAGLLGPVAGFTATTAPVAGVALLSPVVRTSGCFTRVHLGRVCVRSFRAAV